MIARILFLLLLPVLAFGATPAYEKFKGAGTVTVTTNPPNGDVIITGSGGSATNLTSGTNTVYFTNECFVTANQNSNIVIVSGAGTAADNGTYTNAFIGGEAVYRLGSGPGIYFDGADWLLTNGAGVLHYTSSTDYPTGDVWTVTGGAGPAPDSEYGPATNCYTALASSSAFPLTVSSNIYVGEDGNDTNAVRGRLDRKWRNLQPALIAANRRPDCVVVFPGRYPEQSAYGAQFWVSNTVTLMGSGRGVTIIGTEGGAEQGMQVGSCVLQDFTLFGQVNVGGVGTTATNALLNNLDIVGNSDAIFVSDFETLLTVNNCRLVSTYDGLAEWEATPGGSNRVIRLLNSDILVTNVPGFGTVHGISFGDSRIEMFGGSIETRHGHIDCFPLYCSVDTTRTNKTGSALLSNVRLRTVPTNQVARFTTNFNNLPIFLDNCTMETVRGNLVSGTYTQQWSDRVIDIPNGAARSNRVMTLTSLTNALVNASQIGHRFTICDGGGTASGTNVQIIVPLVNGSPMTNIVNDWACLTFEVMSNNVVRMVGAYP